MRYVSRPVSLVVPISLYEVRTQLWRVLRYYKDGPADPAQNRFRAEVTALLARFTRDHADCIARAGGEWDTVTIVPSSQGREGQHPLEDVVRRIPWLRVHFRSLLVRTNVALAPHYSSDDKYAVTEDVTGRRVLLVDDTFTAGSNIQSAASRLQLAGAVVVAAAVIGRVIRPEYNERVRIFWTTARREQFRFDTCCVGEH